MFPVPQECGIYNIGEPKEPKHSKWEKFEDLNWGGKRKQITKSVWFKLCKPLYNKTWVIIHQYWVC